MGGPEIIEKQPMADPNNRESKRVTVEIDDVADERFEEGRYVGLYLLADMAPYHVVQGGVTPVVTK